MPEYIAKIQAIALAESLRPIAGNGITDAFIKGIEGLETQHWVKFFNTDIGSVCEPIDGVWYRTPKE